MIFGKYKTYFATQYCVEMRVSTRGPFHWEDLQLFLVRSVMLFLDRTFISLQCFLFAGQARALYGFAFLLGQGFTTCWSCQSLFWGFNLSMRRTDSGLFQKASISFGKNSVNVKFFPYHFTFVMLHKVFTNLHIYATVLWVSWFIE